MLIELGDAEGDQAIVVEAEKDLEAIRAKAETMQVEGLLSGEADGNDCYLEVHAGAGGTEAQDWAEMLLRMYTRWAERRRSEEHTSELQSLMRTSYAVFCLKKQTST